MRILINATSSLNYGEEKIWSAKNGATRRTLILVDKIGIEENSPIKGELGYLDKGNHSFIFLNKEKKFSDKIIGIFLCSEYGYRVVSGKEIYSAYSQGGYGNSESKFGIYEVGTIIAADSYKSRNGETFYKLTPMGWEELGIDIPLKEEGDKINIVE